MRMSSTQPQAVKSDIPGVNDSLGKSSRKRHLKIWDVSILFVPLICFVFAVIFITPRLDVAWNLGLQLIGRMLSIMNLCLGILANKLWIMAEAWCSKPELQNLDAILRNLITISNTYVAWRAVLLICTILPIALNSAYKSFTGGNSTRDFANYTSWYGLTAASGLASNGILKFGPSYMTNATLPFIMDSLDPTTQFPQTYGFNNLVISNTSSAFLDGPLPEQVLSLQQSLQEDITSSFTLTADVHATFTTYNHSNDAFWDFYLNQRGRNSTPDSFSSVIEMADLCSNKTLGMLTGDEKTDASWMILSFFKTRDLSGSPDIWITAFRANAFLFNIRREICKATWHITYNSIHLVRGDCSVSSPLPNQDLLVTPTLAGLRPNRCTSGEIHWTCQHLRLPSQRCIGRG